MCVVVPEGLDQDTMDNVLLTCVGWLQDARARAPEALGQLQPFTRMEPCYLLEEAQNTLAGLLLARQAAAPEHCQVISG